MSQPSRSTRANRDTRTATRTEDDALARLVDALALRLTAAEERPPPVATTRAQFAYTMLGELLGRTTLRVSRVDVVRGVADNDTTASLTFVTLNGGSVARLLARDATLKTFDNLTEGQTVDTGIPKTVPIDVVVVLAADGTATGIALCPPPPPEVD